MGLEYKHYQFFHELLCNDCDRPMSKHDIHAELIKQKKIYIEMYMIDNWLEWQYDIVREDCMAPFFESYKSFYDYKEGFYTYDLALENALIRVYNDLNNIKNE